jgi:hypothetical protein
MFAESSKVGLFLKTVCIALNYYCLSIVWSKEINNHVVSGRFYFIQGAFIFPV